MEQRYEENCWNIPVFHDDQHGTAAIIAAAGLINALDLTGRDIESTKLVCNGAGAAGIACLELLKAIRFTPTTSLPVDGEGIVYRRRRAWTRWKSASSESLTFAEHAGRRRRLLQPSVQEMMLLGVNPMAFSSCATAMRPHRAVVDEPGRVDVAAGQIGVSVRPSCTR